MATGHCKYVTCHGRPGLDPRKIAGANKIYDFLLEWKTAFQATLEIYKKKQLSKLTNVHN